MDSSQIMYLFEALILHCLAVGFMLLAVLFHLRRLGLFHWLSAGFWAAATFCLYFFAVPLVNWLTGEMYFLETRLAVTEGIPRLLWVTFCIAVGMAAFFGTYFKTGLRKVTFGLNDNRLPPGAWLILALALLAAAYALIKFRGSFATSTHQVLIEGGKFTGDIVGYQYMAHMLALFPLAFLIINQSTRKLGCVLAAVYIAARFEDGWDRQSVVSLLLALSMITAALKHRLWPRWTWLLIILLITSVLTIRGHSTFMDFLARGSFNPQTTRETLSEGDSAMLATLWLESYLADKGGYNFGLPTLNRALFGMIPRKYFPRKDEAIETIFALRPANTRLDIYGLDMMHGAKSTVIGDWYNWGGVIMVALGMAVLGFLARRLDGMLTSESPSSVRVLGFLWLGHLWMLLAGVISWALACLFLTALPFIAVAGWQKMLTAIQGQGVNALGNGMRLTMPKKYIPPRTWLHR
jgi:hypothetical protein